MSWLYVDNDNSSVQHYFYDVSSLCGQISLPCAGVVSARLRCTCNTCRNILKSTKVYGLTKRIKKQLDTINQKNLHNFGCDTKHMLHNYLTSGDLISFDDLVSIISDSIDKQYPVAHVVQLISTGRYLCVHGCMEYRP